MRWPWCCWPSTTPKLVSTCARRVVRARPGAGCNCWRRPVAKGKCGAPAEQPEEIGLKNRWRHSQRRAVVLAEITSSLLLEQPPGRRLDFVEGPRAQQALPDALERGV